MITPELRRIRLIVADEDKRQTVRKLHKIGQVHVTSTDHDELADDTSLPEAEEVSDLLLSFRYLEQHLSPPDQQTLDELPSLKRTVTEAERFLDTHLEDIKTIAQRQEQITNEKTDIQDQLTILHHIPDELYDYENPIIFKGTVEKDIDNLQTETTEQDTYHLLTADGLQKARLTKDLNEQLRRVDLSLVETTIQETITTLEQRYEDLSSEQEKLTADLSSQDDKLAPKRSYLHACLKAHYNELTLPNNFSSNQDIAVIDGYCEPDVVETVKDRLPEATLYEDDPDDAPTKLKETGLNKSFRSVTSMFDIPKYQAFDPTGYVSLFFPLFFGFMFADIGYGLLVLLLALTAKQLTGPDTQQYTHILSVSALTTIGFGVLFGSFFGELVPAEPLWLEPFQASFYLLKVSLVIGALHMNLGVLTNLYQLIHQSKPVTTILQQVAPLPLAETGAILCYYQQYYMGITALTFSTGLLIARDGFIGALGLSDYLGTWFSYARLLALTLATTGIALAVNLISSRLAGIPYLGSILQPITLILGHTFNYVVNLLGTTINAARLHYVEFFDLFFQGGGHRFTPFKIP